MSIIDLVPSDVNLYADLLRNIRETYQNSPGSRNYKTIQLHIRSMSKYYRVRIKIIKRNNTLM